MFLSSVVLGCQVRAVASTMCGWCVAKTESNTRSGLSGPTPHTSFFLIDMLRSDFLEQHARICIWSHLCRSANCRLRSRQILRRICCAKCKPLQGFLFGNKTLTLTLGFAENPGMPAPSGLSRRGHPRSSRTPRRLCSCAAPLAVKLYAEIAYIRRSGGRGGPSILIFPSHRSRMLSQTCMR